jgi:hypothetical protein
LGGERVDFWDRMKSIVLSFWREEQADWTQNVSSMIRQRQPGPGANDVDCNDPKAISSWSATFLKYIQSGLQWPLPGELVLLFGRTLRVNHTAINTS